MSDGDVYKASYVIASSIKKLIFPTIVKLKLWSIQKKRILL